MKTYLQRKFERMRFMKINTKYLGEMEIDETKIIHFESGLPGFFDEKSFVVLDIPGNDILQILQSVTTPELAFIVTNPHYFYEDYEFKLDDSVIELLDIKKKEEIVVMSILTVRDPFHTSTINLKAPLVINWSNKRGKQVILNDGKYPMKASISLSASSVEGE